MSNRPLRAGDRVTVTEAHSSFDDEVHTGLVTHVDPAETSRSGVLLPPLAYVRLDPSYVSPVTGNTITQTVICLNDDMTTAMYAHLSIEQTASAATEDTVMDTPTENDQTPLEQARAALARAVADDLYAASTTGDVIDMLVKGDYENWREHVERIGGIAAESTLAAVHALMAGDWLQKTLRRHSEVGTGDPSNWECGGCGEILTGRDTDDEPDDEHVLDALAAHQAAAIRATAVGALGCSDECDNCDSTVDIDQASGLCPTCLWTTEGASS